MKKFLIYVDILGFEKLGKENEFLKEEEIRKIGIERVQNKINELKNTKKIERSEKISLDSWLLFVEKISYVFSSISKLLETELQFEIAVDCKEFPKSPSSEELVSLKGETISFLKNDIISLYKSKYKDKHNQESIKETFIVITNDFYNELENYQKRYCEEINYKGKHFYNLNKKLIEREAKISDFLSKIGQSKSDLSGALIDKVFVPPNEYEEIKKSLEDKKIVFITGTAGYGKTYLAIRLLWEKFNEGYIPRWISGKEEKQRELVREKFVNIEAELKPRHIIYFEDPFGKVKYEKREELEDNIRRIIDSVKNVKDCFVVITSRKDVFEKFKEESGSATEKLNKIETELNIIKPSYSDEKRKEILEKWAEEKECKWLSNYKLKNLVFDSIKNEGKLPTPFAIYNFVAATKNETDENIIKQKIDEYSGELSEIFAKEIIELYNSGREDRVLFLSFIFVSEEFKTDFVKWEYEKLKKEKFEDFEKILKEEYRIKEEKCFLDEKMLKFTHPSYSQCLPHILKNIKCRNIFCSVLKELSKKDSTAWNVAHIVANNFENLPDNVRNELLLELAKKDSAARSAAYIVANNFEKLPDNVRNLLFELAKKDSVAWGVAYAVANNFEKLPDNVRNLLFELAKKDSAVWDVAYAVANNFEKLPDNVRNELLLELAKKDSAAWGVALAVANNFEKLPGNVRNLLFIDKVQKALKVIIENLSTSNYIFDKERAEKFKRFLKE